MLQVFFASAFRIGWRCSSPSSSVIFALSSSLSHPQNELPAAVRPITAGGQAVNRVLVLGDGDFSFSSAILSLLPVNVKLIATCLHTRKDTITQYPKAAETLTELEKHPHQAQIGFEIDATALSTSLDKSFSTTSSMSSFERIIFNFPHYPGKTNTARNRQLIQALLSNAVNHLAEPGGEILLALCRGQGGTEAKTLREYKASWKLPLYASEAGLVISDIESFDPVEMNLYQPTGRRDRQSVFSHRDPRLYTLLRPQALQAPAKYGPAFAHELNMWILRPQDFNVQDLENAVRRIIGDEEGEKKRLVSITHTDTYHPSNDSDQGRIAQSYKILYANALGILTREEADGLRTLVEKRIEEEMGNGQVISLRQGKHGFMVRDETWTAREWWTQHHHHHHKAP